MEVGQKLYYQPYKANVNRDKQPSGYQVVVTKVGRIWTTVQNPVCTWEVFRIDNQTMTADGKQHISPGKCWYSKELYQEEMNRLEAWDTFRSLVGGNVRPPKHLSLRDILNLEAKVYARGETGLFTSGQDV